MASTIQIKNSNTAGNSPSSLTQGELAINVNDGNLFYGDGSSVKQDFVLGSVSASGGFTGSIDASGINGTIDISDQTNLAGGTNLTLSGDTMNLDADISLTSVTSSVILTDTRHLPNTDGSNQYYGDVVTFGGGGTLTQGSIYYLNSSKNWALADASAASTAQGMLGIATSTGIEILVKGIARHGSWASLGTGNPLYLSETAGELTATKPTTSGAIVRVVGYSTDSSVREIYFNPSTDWIELA